jgi:hypothetical protein
VVDATRIDRDFIPAQKRLRDRGGASSGSIFCFERASVLRRGLKTWPECIADAAGKPARPSGHGPTQYGEENDELAVQYLFSLTHSRIVHANRLCENALVAAKQYRGQHDLYIVSTCRRTKFVEESLS